jgi:hypothetical protein
VALAYGIQCILCDAADIPNRGWDHVCYNFTFGRRIYNEVIESKEVSITKPTALEGSQNMPLFAELQAMVVSLPELNVLDVIGGIEKGNDGRQ